MDGEFGEIGGFRTHFHRSGRGNAIVLLHGSGPGVSAWENWNGVFPAFSEKFSVFAPDIVGFGRTVLPDTVELNIKVWVGHLIAFLDAMEIGRAVLVGNSFGGGLSLASALRHSDRIAGMILMGTPSGEFEQSNSLAIGYDYQPSLEAMGKTLRNFPFDPSIITDKMIKQRHELSLTHVGNAAFRKLMPKPSAEGKPQTVRGVPLEQLERIQCPVLLLHGQQDRVIPSSVSVRAQQHLPSSDVQIFGQCGHWVQIEKREKFLDASFSFLKQIGW
jgi:2-hydroxy-6-oxo-octa-2,4-dienoate hydrolase